MSFEVPLGPLNKPLVFDDFSYEDVKEGKCFASVSKNVCEALKREAPNADTRYLCICLPCYNEQFEELLKTFLSLMENIEFMQRKARMHDDDSGRQLKRDFVNTIPVIVPIFDGTKAISPSIRDWLKSNFKGALDGLDGPSRPGETEVRIVSSKWWYYCDDTIAGDENSAGYDVSRAEKPDDELVPRISNSISRRRADTAGGTTRTSLGERNHSVSKRSIHERVSMSALSGHHSGEKFGDEINLNEIIYFHVVPIIKRSNHRKHNSHEWFFNSICQGLDNLANVAFLTDCGTTYNATCLARLFYELYFKKDLIGVTARQRVETPNAFFHPCEEAPFPWFRGDHTASGDRRPCWKCYATYFFSPCPLQGFEFEASLIMNSAMFNLVEALPVMPGPCQLLDWQKMKKFKVVDEYFNLLFKGEADNTVPLKLHSSLRLMEKGGNVTVLDHGNSNLSEKLVDSSVDSSSHGLVSPSTKSSAAPETISFTEFLRVNMRLAEDRILSFVCVFSTGYGTKWIPGATFFYQPEIRWQTLLTQRRRWLNGTFASFLFFFNSKRAKSRISGGMFDSHKAGKNIRFVNALWSLQLMQLLLVLIAPAVFGSSSYIGLHDSARIWPEGFGWATTPIHNSNVSFAEIWLGIYLFIYAVWTLNAFYAPGGKVPEWVCSCLAIIGILYVIPIYFGVWASIFTQGLDVVDGIVIVSLALPVVIALAQSATSAALYVLYLPWFLFLILFFLVYIPSYSFARLWDTTWGNRAGGNDSAITDSVQNQMKSSNFIFISILIAVNVLVAWGIMHLLDFGYSVVLTFMFVVFFPMIVQLVCSFIFLFIVMPLRNLTARPNGDKPEYQKHDSNNMMSSPIA